jgi:hypothetical protein
MATRWFRGIHPVAPELDPTMRAVLVVSAVSFSALSACLVIQRRRVLALAERAAELESAMWHSNVTYP